MSKPFKDGKHELETGFYSYAELTVKGAVDNTARGTLIMPIKADWGPENVMIELNSFDDNPFFGQTAHLVDLARKTKLKTLKVMRLATASAKKATVALDTVNVTAKYAGTRGNGFKVTVRPQLGETGVKQLILTEGTNELDRVSFATIDELITKTKFSSYITISKIDGKTETTVGDANNIPLVGGNSGEVVKTENYSDFLNLAKAEVFDGITFDGITDAALKTMLVQFVQTSRVSGRLITGYTAGEGSTDIDYYGIANCVQKAKIDERLYTPQEVAVYMAAALLSCPLNESVAQKATPFTWVEKLSVEETKGRIATGNIVFFQEGKKVRFNTPVNTMTTLKNLDAVIGMSEESDPSATIRTLQKVKVVLGIDYITNAQEVIFNRYISKANTQAKRIAAAQAIKDELLERLAQEEVIELGSFNCYEDPRHTQDLGKPVYKDEAFFITEYTIVDAIEKVYNKNKVS
ncbi:phage tail sheath N-terminal beta-sandwich domain-containing protein [Bacillus wiedmannii]|uniref:phage tail sheath N-terminal beta-sandwich domain-containing protein n=1 Tax=Bacillus wiedmannii TaxID=1890302 RepID=UPI000B43EE1B|nr:phage tail sheath subtilisin-like domain-containing protein [Bacillus wiedmannii]OUB89748.1 hypothetical protein BK788_02675 [Bacillus thuringiensis serovar sinensis]